MRGEVHAYVLIDANIARSASEPAKHPRSIASRRVAEVLQDLNCPTAVGFTPALDKEWRKHATSLMTRWLVAMENLHRINRKNDKAVASFRRAIKQLADPNIRLAIEKDMHLTEAAINNGWSVLSLDDKQRRHLRDLALHHYAPVGSVAWVNPVTDQDWELWVATSCSMAYDHRCLPADL